MREQQIEPHPLWPLTLWCIGTYLSCRQLQWPQIMSSSLAESWAREQYWKRLGECYDFPNHTASDHLGLSESWTPKILLDPMGSEDFDALVGRNTFVQRAKASEGPPGLSVRIKRNWVCAMNFGDCVCLSLRMYATLDMVTTHVATGWKLTHCPARPLPLLASISRYCHHRIGEENSFGSRRKFYSPF